MSRTEPVPGCLDLTFARGYSLSDAAEVALEDYARALAAGGSAETLPDAGDPAAVSGVHVCAAAPPSPVEEVRADLEGFARELAARGGNGSLGWE
jgi:hypothetical protein